MYICISYLLYMIYQIYTMYYQCTMNCLKYKKYVLSCLMFSRLDSKSHIARVIDHKMTAKSCKKPCVFS